MAGNPSIQVPLPADVHPTGDDLVLLKDTLREIVQMYVRGNRTWRNIDQALTADGWTVRSRLMWVAEAKKGHDYEQATGTTRDEAFAQLQQLARLDTLAGVP